MGNNGEEDDIFWEEWRLNNEDGGGGNEQNVEEIVEIDDIKKFYHKDVFTDILKKITSEERTYYREFFGFDPVTFVVQVNVANCKYRYEENFLLVNDDELLNAGISVSARVDVEHNGFARNRIVFFRDNIESSIECIHTIISNIKTEDMAKLGKDVLETRGNVIALHPWCHFAALKSFVAGIVDIGIHSLLIDFISSDSSYGIPSNLIYLILRALDKLVPNLTSDFRRKILMEILETASTKWLETRKNILDWLGSPLDIFAIWQYASEGWLLSHLSRMRVLFSAENFLGSLRLCNDKAVLSHNILRVLSTDSDPNVRKIIAKNPFLSLHYKRQMFFDSDLEVSLETIRNPSNTSELLNSIFKEIDTSQDEILAAFASHPNTPISLLRQLILDESINVHFNLIQNPSTPYEIIEQLARSSNSLIIEQVFNRVKLKRSIKPIWRIKILKSIAINRNTPARILVQLSYIKSPEILEVIIMNQDLPILQLKILERTVRSSKRYPNISEFISLRVNQRDLKEIENLPVLSFPQVFSEIVAKIKPQTLVETNELRTKLNELRMMNKIRVSSYMNEIVYWNRYNYDIVPFYLQAIGLPLDAKSRVTTFIKEGRFPISEKLIHYSLFQRYPMVRVRYLLLYLTSEGIIKRRGNDRFFI